MKIPSSTVWLVSDQFTGSVWGWGLDKLLVFQTKNYN